MRRSCLMTHENMAQLGMLEQGIVNRKDSAAGIAEYDFHTLLDKRVHQYICAGFFFHVCIISFFCWFRRIKRRGIQPDHSYAALRQTAQERAC
jgi:hypothetical protein